MTKPDIFCKDSVENLFIGALEIVCHFQTPNLESNVNQNFENIPTRGELQEIIYSLKIKKVPRRMESLMN